MNNTDKNLCKGRVSAIHKNSYTIRFKGKDISAKHKGTFYDEASEQLPVVGDYVSFAYNENGDSLIVSVYDRSSFLQRPDQSKTGVMQYMVANVDYTFWGNNCEETIMAVSRITANLNCSIEKIWNVVT